MKLEHYLTAYTKIKLLEEERGKIFCDINCSNIFLDQGKRNKSKNKQMELNQTYKLCTAKETINKTKRQSTDWEKILANTVTDKGLISKIYKQLIQLNI